MADVRESEHVGEVFSRRLKEVRTRRGWSQTELAERMEDYGRPFKRQTIAKLETPAHSRARNVPLEDVMAFAAVLGVAPVHLFIPLEDDARVRLFTKPGEPLRDEAGEIRRDSDGQPLRPDPGLVPARTAREWVRGRGHVLNTNFQLFYSEQPAHEREAMLKQSEESARRTGIGEPLDAGYLSPTTDELRDIAGDERPANHSREGE